MFIHYRSSVFRRLIIMSDHTNAYGKIFRPYILTLGKKKWIQLKVLYIHKDLKIMSSSNYLIMQESRTYRSCQRCVILYQLFQRGSLTLHQTVLRLSYFVFCSNKCKGFHTSIRTIFIEHKYPSTQFVSSTLQGQPQQWAPWQSYVLAH